MFEGETVNSAWTSSEALSEWRLAGNELVGGKEAAGKIHKVKGKWKKPTADQLKVNADG